MGGGDNWIALQFGFGGLVCVHGGNWFGGTDALFFTLLPTHHSFRRSLAGSERGAAQASQVDCGPDLAQPGGAQQLAPVLRHPGSGQSAGEVQQLGRLFSLDNSGLCVCVCGGGMCVVCVCV